MVILQEKIKEAIEWLKEQNEKVDGFTMAFSGGKDSTVAYDIAKRANIKINSVKFALSGVDPPELMKFIRDNYPEVIFVKPKRYMNELIASDTCLNRTMQYGNHNDKNKMEDKIKV